MAVDHRREVSIGDLVVDEALARALSTSVDGSWSLASPAVRALGRELADLFDEDELHEGLLVVGHRSPSADEAVRRRLVTLIEVAAATARARAPGNDR